VDREAEDRVAEGMPEVQVEELAMRKSKRRKWNIPEGMTWLDFIEENDLTIEGDPRVDRNGPTTVYVLQIEGTRYFKIGQSARPARRAEVFAAWTPFPIKIVLRILCPTGYWSRTVEAAIHRVFEAERKPKSEWFELSRADFSYLKGSVAPRVVQFMKKEKRDTKDLVSLLIQERGRSAAKRKMKPGSGLGLGGNNERIRR
jgi:Meiotically Up-regulated Gene 113 (MUG113) protein